MSSIINTVFPTPAPPNRPIFPPFWYGASKSTTYKMACIIVRFAGTNIIENFYPTHTITLNTYAGDLSQSLCQLTALKHKKYVLKFAVNTNNSFAEKDATK